MALFKDHKGRERNPLGGREADGWDWWIQATTQQVREGRKATESLPLENIGRCVAVSAERQYDDVLTAWMDVKRGRSAHVRDDLARDHFEVTLIAAVMGAYGAANYARECGYGPDDTTAGGRPMADVSAEYVRACLILAQYVGVDDGTVAACRDDQAALTALRNTRA